VVNNSQRIRELNDELRQRLLGRFAVMTLVSLHSASEQRWMLMPDQIRKAILEASNASASVHRAEVLTPFAGSTKLTVIRDAHIAA
jgi:hypothetical protein